jgi:hypothetical protein
MDDEIDCMSLEEVRAYAKFCRNGWQDLIGHEKEGIGSICVTIGQMFHAFDDNSFVIRSTSSQLLK